MTALTAPPPLSALDVAEIHHLVAAYGLSTDDADVDAFMRTWVEPAAFGGYDGGDFGRIDSWAAMRAFAQQLVGPGGLARGKRHLSLNVVVEAVGPDEARVSNDLLVVEVAEAPRLVASGRYDASVVVRTVEGWRFKRRTLAVDGGFFKLLAAQMAQADDG